LKGGGLLRFSVRSIKSIKELREEDWESLTGTHAFSSYGWLKTIEETFTEDANPRYVLLEDGGRLQGAAVCYVLGIDFKYGSFNELMFGRLTALASSLGMTFHPLLVCNPMNGYGSHFLFGDQLGNESKAVAQKTLLEGIENLARKEGIPIGFINVTDNEKELAELLKKSEYEISSGPPVHYMDIPWTSFDQYLTHIGSISSKTRSSIRREINKNRNEGVSIKPINDIEKNADRLMELVRTTYSKYNRNPLPFNRLFFIRLKENLGDRALVYGSFRSEEITGVISVLKQRDEGYITMPGMASDRASNDFTYFNITYYRPIEDAISKGLKRLYFGTGADDLKRRRGCSRLDTQLFFKPSNGRRSLVTRAWFAIHRKWWAAKQPREKAGEN
jgi:predicted N-acyltransferase